MKEQEFVLVKPQDVEKVSDPGILESIATAATQRIGFLREADRRKRMAAENDARNAEAVKVAASARWSQRVRIAEVRKQLDLTDVNADVLLDVVIALLLSLNPNSPPVAQWRDIVRAIQEGKQIK
jgi:hypothetical protein